MFKITKAALESLLKLSEDRSRILSIIQQVEGLRSGNGVHLHKSPQGITIYLEEKTAQEITRASHGLWVKVISSGVVIADAEWGYELRPQKDGHATATDGLQDNGTTNYSGKNTWEDSRLTNAGYENAGVTGLCKIPNGAIVWARWQLVDDAVMLIFSERNEPLCG